MKKIVLTSSLLFVLVINLSAQITINRGHMMNSGQRSVLVYDYQEYPLSSGGANMVWDYSMLVEDARDTIRFGLSQWYPGYTDFPGANLALIYNSDDSSYEYIKIDDNGYTSLGYYGIYNGVYYTQKFDYRTLSFPSTFKTSFTESTSVNTGSVSLGFDPDDAGPMPFIDSMSYILDAGISSNMDGYGSIKTPLGTFSCLRQKLVTIQILKNVKMFSKGAWKPMPNNIMMELGISTQPDTSNMISFWTDDASIGRPLLQYYYSEGDKTTHGMTWTAARTEASSIPGIVQNEKIFMYPNPCHSTLNISLPVSTIAELSVFDINGKRMQVTNVENGSAINISAYEKGFYIVKLRDVNSGILLDTRKIIKY
jgi:hypothetical protein